MSQITVTHSALGSPSSRPSAMHSYRFTERGLTIGNCRADCGTENGSAVSELRAQFVQLDRRKPVHPLKLGAVQLQQQATVSTPLIWTSRRMRYRISAGPVPPARG